MAGEKFYLIFSEQPTKRVQINEPINYSEVDFVLERRKNGMALDVSLSGGSVSFKFTMYRHGSAFDKILYYAHRYGFEADVKLIIVLSTGQEYTGELDFAMAETNDFNYFECPVILESQMQIFRRRSETKVDLFSNLSTDNVSIEPLVPVNMLLQAKPTFQESIWKDDEEKTSSFVAKYFINFAQKQTKYDLNNSYVPYVLGGDSDVIKDNPLVELENNAENISLIFDLKFKGIFSGLALGVTLKYFVGRKESFNPSSNGITIATSGTEGILEFKGAVNVPSANRGEYIWIYAFITPGIGSYPVTQFISYYYNVSVSANSITYNSIVRCFRLIDVMKQIAKSTANLEVFAPRYDFGGEFYDTVLTNGKMLGGNTTDPFYVSWDDLEKSFIAEHHADSEIQSDKRVFIGIEDDFYANIECGFFNNTQFSGLNRKPNPLYMLNEFGLKYENYQSLKESTEPNSESTIHGETKFTPFNKRVENSRELTVKWIRDAILLDVQQRLSTKVSSDTATQDDDKIFAIDTIETENDQRFTESTSLQHTFSNSQLSLRSNGDVNFLVLGIKEGTGFTIEYPDKNAGIYNVVSVTNTEVILTKTSGGSISASNDGIRLTKYTYEIKKETIPLTNRTNQGFDVILNLLSPDKYSNLRYSVQRNIRNYWNRFLATVNIYHKDKVLKNTFYKNNALCETEYNGLRVVEKEDWIPNDPIVTPYMYEDVVFANVDFEKVLAMWDRLRLQRGYIRTIDNNKHVLKLYPIKMSYENKSRQLTISGQEKFEKSYLTIVKQNGIITVNDETRLLKLTYDEIVLDRDKQVVLYDLERQRLYNGIYWDKVSINGAVPETIEILKTWLDLL